jgi:hypothetical protein
VSREFIVSEIYLHNKRVNSVFALLGEHENDISYSVAWALAQCPSFLHDFLEKVLDVRAGSSDIEIRLQHHETEGGITDIEIELPNELYLIIEAKRGWNLPNQNQLEKYAKRSSFVKSKATLKRLVVMSECSNEYATRNLQIQNIGNIKINPVSWQVMATLATDSQVNGTYAEKRLLRELVTYLGGLMTMQNMDSNWVYVVSLGGGIPDGWNISWIDIVKKRSQYFHPMGVRGWPKDPPNYIAFRYFGKLQSVHHIEDYEVVTNMHTSIPEIPDEEWNPHFLYKLGMAFCPINEVKTGKIYPNGRVWCMLDTLFTSDTISAARDLSKKRQEKTE